MGAFLGTPPPKKKKNALYHTVQMALVDPLLSMGFKGW